MDSLEYLESKGWLDDLARTIREDAEIAADLDAIRNGTLPKASDYPLRYAHELPQCCCIKVAGEWCVFHRLDEDGNLVLSRTGSACTWTYPVTEGESFVTCEPF